MNQIKSVFKKIATYTVAIINSLDFDVIMWLYHILSSAYKTSSKGLLYIMSEHLEATPSLNEYCTTCPPSQLIQCQNSVKNAEVTKRVSL